MYIAASVFFKYLLSVVCDANSWINHISMMPVVDSLGLNSLASGRFENNFQNVFFKLISWIDTLSNSCETVLKRMPQNPSDDKSTLVQVMAWCRQATGHYLSQCCPRSLSPYASLRWKWQAHKNRDKIPINSSIKSKPQLVQIMARCRIGIKPFFRPMMAKFT